MGIIKAAEMAIKGGLADQWLEVMEPHDMGEQTVFTCGVKTRKGENVKGTDNLVSNGSYIRVYENQVMLLVDGGKVVDFTAEAGYYKVDDSSSPSLFAGDFGGTLKDAWERIKFGGETPREQKVYYVNLQEIKGIKFGTRSPISYFDNFYNAELFIRAHGTYSIKITNPLQFYAEVIPKNKDHVEFVDIKEQFVSEFLQALQASINQLSADGTRVSHVISKAMELGKYMASALDEDWNKMRGMEIQSVGIASISYDEESQKLINMRNEGAMLSDASVREGYMQGHVARGLEAAGSNEGGAMQGFMGMGMGMQMGGNMAGQMSQTNMQQMQMQQQMQAQQAQAQQAQAQTSQSAGDAAQADDAVAGAASTSWTCECGQVNSGKFCQECGKPAPKKDWTCECGHVNVGKFCTECGKPRT